jgi:hypothetical protein
VAIDITISTQEKKNILSALKESLLIEEKRKKMLKIKVKINSLIGKYACYDREEGQKDEESGKFTAYRITSVIDRDKVKVIYQGGYFNCGLDAVTIRDLEDIPKDYLIYHD